MPVLWRLGVRAWGVQLVAVVIPDPEQLLPWAKERGLPRDLAELCKLPQVGWVGVWVDKCTVGSASRSAG